MKITKPNITKGEWSVNRLDDTFIEPRICEIPHNGCYNYDHIKYNAKAISAVPDMIDELICTHRILNHQLESLKWLQNQNVNIGKWVENQRELIEARLRNNEKALTKAGCTYE